MIPDPHEPPTAAELQTWREAYYGRSSWLVMSRLLAEAEAAAKLREENVSLRNGNETLAKNWDECCQRLAVTGPNRSAFEHRIGTLESQLSDEEEKNERLTSRLAAVEALRQRWGAGEYRDPIWNKQAAKELGEAMGER